MEKGPNESLMIVIGALFCRGGGTETPLFERGLANAGCCASAMLWLWQEPAGSTEDF